jgi:hypothetical protein
VELNEELNKLHVLATAPELYGELVRHNSVSSLLHLLSHENSDISIATIALLAELTEIDTLAETEGAIALVEALVRHCPVVTLSILLCSPRAAYHPLHAVYCVLPSVSTHAACPPCRHALPKSRYLSRTVSSAADCSSSRMRMCLSPCVCARARFCTWAFVALLLTPH